VSLILKWLADKYPWVCSGVGVGLLFGVVGWLLRRKGKSAHGSCVNISKSSISGSVVAGRDNIIQTVNISPSHDPTDDEYSETPTADEIREQTNSLPFLWQEAARTSYKGIKVKWPARISYFLTLARRNIVVENSSHCGAQKPRQWSYPSEYSPLGGCSRAAVFHMIWVCVPQS